VTTIVTAARKIHTEGKEGGGGALSREGKERGRTSTLTALHHVCSPYHRGRPLHRALSGGREGGGKEGKKSRGEEKKEEGGGKRAVLQTRSVFYLSLAYISHFPSSAVRRTPICTRQWERRGKEKGGLGLERKKGGRRNKRTILSTAHSFLPGLVLVPLPLVNMGVRRRGKKRGGTLPQEGRGKAKACYGSRLPVDLFLRREEKGRRGGGAMKEKEKKRGGKGEGALRLCPY